MGFRRPLKRRGKRNALLGGVKGPCTLSGGPGWWSGVSVSEGGTSILKNGGRKQVPPGLGAREGREEQAGKEDEPAVPLRSLRRKEVDGETKKKRCMRPGGAVLFSAGESVRRVEGVEGGGRKDCEFACFV